jgi:hypothetical protein
VKWARANSVLLEYYLEAADGVTVPAYIVIKDGRLNRRIPASLSDLEVDRLAGVNAWRYENQVRAFSLGRGRRHCRVHPEFPDFVAGHRDAVAGLHSANGDRRAAQLRIIPLFDRSIERIHADMDDFAGSVRLESHPYFTLLNVYFSLSPVG